MLQNSKKSYDSSYLKSCFTGLGIRIGTRWRFGILSYHNQLIKILKMWWYWALVEQCARSESIGAREIISKGLFTLLGCFATGHPRQRRISSVESLGNKWDKSFTRLTSTQVPSITNVFSTISLLRRPPTSLCQETSDLAQPCSPSHPIAYAFSFPCLSCRSQPPSLTHPNFLLFPPHTATVLSTSGTSLYCTLNVKNELPRSKHLVPRIRQRKT